MGIKFLYITCILLLQYEVQAQQSVDSVHHLFRGKLDGDKIRETYDYFELSMPIGKPKNSAKFNDITLSIFHSKKLYIKTGLHKKENIKDLEPFKYIPNTATASMMGQGKRIII